MGKRKFVPPEVSNPKNQPVGYGTGRCEDCASRAIAYSDPYECPGYNRPIVMWECANCDGIGWYYATPAPVLQLRPPKKNPLAREERIEGRITRKRRPTTE